MDMGVEDQVSLQPARASLVGGQRLRRTCGAGISRELSSCSWAVPWRWAAEGRRAVAQEST